MFKCFQKFKARVEKENRHMIQVVRSNRKGDFISKNFKELYNIHGTGRFLTALGLPQQKGVIKRKKNQTILNMAKSIMKTKRMPKEF